MARYCIQDDPWSRAHGLASLVPFTTGHTKHRTICELFRVLREALARG